MPHQPPETSNDDHGFGRLVAILDRLRDPGGCPWDREQTLRTLEPHLVEETHELLEAMSGPPPAHCEELGDVLLQILFQARLRREEGAFSISEVVAGLSDKLIRRHPHVFGDAEAKTAEEGLRSWEGAKRAEGKPAGSLSGVPSALPAAMRAQRVSAEAARAGFDWPDAGGVIDKVHEELAEVEEARGLGGEALYHELGDLLFAVVNLARHLGMDAEGALRAATRRFVERFEGMEARLAERGRSVAEAGFQELDAAWEAEKAARTRGVT